jgi:hypothetical protein
MKTKSRNARNNKNLQSLFKLVGKKVVQLGAQKSEVEK